MRRETKYNLIGQKFGKLTVIERVDDIIRHSKGRVNYQVAYLCRCECGNEKIVQQGNLIAGTTKTCGDSRCRAGRATIYNTYDLSGEYGVGYTRKGEEFYFDKEDYDLIKDYHWELHKGYVACHKWSIETQSDHQVKMHRLIMGVLNNNDYRNCQIDHINHNKVDNRKENLRVVNNIQNSWNKKLWHKDGNKVGVRRNIGGSKDWVAEITIDGKFVRLGYFDKYEDAVKARIDAEKKYWGEYRYGKN